MPENLGELFFSVRNDHQKTDADLEKVQEKYRSTVANIESRPVHVHSLIDDQSLDQAIQRISNRLKDVGKIKVELDTSNLQGGGGLAMGGRQAAGGGLLEGLIGGLIGGAIGEHQIKSSESLIGGGATVAGGLNFYHGQRGTSVEQGNFADKYTDVVGQPPAYAVATTMADMANSPGAPGGAGTGANFAGTAGDQMWGALAGSGRGSGTRPHGLWRIPSFSNPNIADIDPTVMLKRASGALARFGITASPGMLGAFGVAAMLDQGIGAAIDQHFHNKTLDAQSRLDPTSLNGDDAIVNSIQNDSTKSPFGKDVEKGVFSIVKNTPFAWRVAQYYQDDIDASNRSVQLQQQASAFKVQSIDLAQRQFISNTQGAISPYRALTPDEQMMDYDRQIKFLGEQSTLHPSGSAAELALIQQRKTMESGRGDSLANSRVEYAKRRGLVGSNLQSMDLSIEAQNLSNEFKPGQAEIKNLEAQARGALGQVDQSAYTPTEYQSVMAKIRASYTSQIRGVTSREQLSFMGVLGQQNSGFLNFGGPQSVYETVQDKINAADTASKNIMGMGPASPTELGSKMLQAMNSMVGFLSKIKTAAGVAGR